MTTTKLVFAIIIACLLVRWVQGQTTTPAEVVLQQKLDEVARANAPVTSAKKKETVKPAKTPATTSGEPTFESLSPHQKRVAILAEELKLRKRMEELHRQEMKLYAPEEKKADKLVAGEEKGEKKAVAIRAESVKNANVRGCDVRKMELNPQVEQPLGWVKFLHPTFVLTVVNKGALNVDEIRSPMYDDPLATNLCSTGSMRMTFYLGYGDSDQIQIPIIAISRPPDGGLAIEENYSITLNRNDYYNRVRGGNWVIGLNRQQQTR